MQLTTQAIERFNHGQIEIQNENKGYLYRGEIEVITVDNNDLRIKFAWLAKGVGFPPLPRKWVKEDLHDKTVSLEIYLVSDIGPSGQDIGGDNRLCLYSSIIGETIVLYPPNGSKLDPSRVEGLHLM